MQCILTVERTPKWEFAAILMQRDYDDGKFHPVHFLSIKTSEAKQKCHSYELVLAVVKEVQKFLAYLRGHRFIIVTDCRALEATMKKRDVAKNLALGTFATGLLL